MPGVTRTTNLSFDMASSPRNPFFLPDQHLDEEMDANDALQLLPVTQTLDDSPNDVYYQSEAFATASNDIVSTTAVSKDKFEVKVDVRKFLPKEIYVRTGGRIIVVIGKHKEKHDNYSFVACQFMRKFIIPEGHDVENIVSELTPNGVLSITVPRINKGMDELWNTPNQETGGPMKAVKYVTGQDGSVKN